MYEDMKSCAPRVERPSIANMIKGMHNTLNELEIVIDGINRNMFGLETAVKEDSSPACFEEACIDCMDQTKRILDKAATLSKRMCE